MSGLSNLRQAALILLMAALLVSLFCFGEISFAGTSKLKIAMILWRGETAAERGFQAELERLGYEVEYTIFNAQQKKERLNSVLRSELDPRKFDIVYTFGTTVSVKTKAFLRQRVPQVFNVVSYPLRSELVEKMSGSEQLIGGVKSDVSLDLQIENAMDVMKFRRLGVLFNPREKNSNITLEELYQLGKTKGFEVIALRSPPVKGRLIRNLDYLADDLNGIDTVFLPADSYITSRMEDIAKALRVIGLRSIGASEKLLAGGILMGSVVDYPILGKHAAMIVDNYCRGVGFEQIPVSTPQPRLVINKETMEGLGLDLQSQKLETSYLQ